MSNLIVGQIVDRYSFRDTYYYKNGRLVVADINSDSFSKLALIRQCLKDNEIYFQTPVKKWFTTYNNDGTMALHIEV